MNAPVQPKADADSSALPSINAEFLPLVREQNMLRVNGVPYAKLKIIGKGGSCKVYSALSAGMDTVAIKRVKLEDLDDKAIAGYSNEIALLKRLQGNPSIIQLHDSEVDYERQAILLVMELGEVDLNHILQKQQTSRGLNMNFIRLTWQVRGGCRLTASQSCTEWRGLFLNLFLFSLSFKANAHCGALDS